MYIAANSNGGGGVNYFTNGSSIARYLNISATHSQTGRRTMVRKVLLKPTTPKRTSFGERKCFTVRRLVATSLASLSQEVNSKLL